MNWHWLVAQCVMCYRTAAAQQVERVRVLNAGIIILLIPNIVVLGLILWLAFRKNEARIAEAATDIGEADSVTASSRSRLG